MSNLEISCDILIGTLIGALVQIIEHIKGKPYTIGIIKQRVKWWALLDSNQRPIDYESTALTN